MPNARRRPEGDQARRAARAGDGWRGGAARGLRHANGAWALTLTYGGLTADVTAQPLATAHGFVESLERPGLGIEVDEVRLRRPQVAARNVA